MTADPDYYIGDFPLILRRHPRAKQLKLRFDARSRAALLTLPPGVSDRKALQFARKHHDWLQDQNDLSPGPTPLRPGEVIPYEGRPVKIIHAPEKTAAIRITGTDLIVGGPLSGFETRLQNWLRKQARHAFETAVNGLAPTLGREPHKIMVRDGISRWGSCSSRKTLSLSWRLIMAHPDILRYVVAHEMAHLVEMNHSAAFWRLVTKLCPHWEDSRHWLKTEGSRLMLIG